jgi:hypothetical protein
MRAPVAPVSSAQLAEAERLLQVVNGEGNIAGGTGPSVEPTARTFVKQLDLQNPAWGPTHAQWGSMIALVKSDLEPKVASRMAQIRAAGERAFAQGMGERLTAAELVRLAQFFSTASGQRYLSFEHALLPIDTDAQEAMSLGSQPAPEPPRVSQAIFEQRVQVLSRSFSWQAGRSDSTAGGSSAEDSPLQMMGYRVAFTAQRQGPAIDRVARLYAHDFPSFDRFNESVRGKRFFSAWSAAFKADAEATGADTLALDDYINHQFHDQWMQAYQERVQQPPRPGVLTATAPAGH